MENNIFKSSANTFTPKIEKQEPKSKLIHYIFWWIFMALIVSLLLLIITQLWNWTIKVPYAITKVWASDNIQQIVNYAYNISKDKAWLDMVLTFDYENGLWTTDRVSKWVSKAWYRDYGICQLNYQWHKKFIESEDFKDPYKQLDYCYKVWQDAYTRWWVAKIKSTFYWYYHKEEVRKNFIIN